MDRVTLPLPTSVYAADDLAVLALRVRHADGCQWAVAGDVLTLVTPSLTWTADLSTQTLGALVTALTAAGFEVAYQNPDLVHLSALVLREGSGDQAASNGDHLSAYTAPLAVLQAAMGRVLAAGRASVPQALAQIILPDATAEWADLFGLVYGIPRPAGMGDLDYTQHIIAEVTRLRSNPAAMWRNLEHLTGLDFEIREPWKEIGFLSDAASPLSGNKHLQGAPIYEYHTLQIRHVGGVPFADVMMQVLADKPAGTVLLAPAVLIDEIRVTGPSASYFAVLWRQAVRHTFVYWNTTTWTNGWDDRRWTENLIPISITGLPGS